MTNKRMFQMEKCLIVLAIVCAELTALGEAQIVSSEVRLNEDLSRAEAMVRVSGCMPGERVRIRLCVDRDARSVPVTGNGMYELAVPLRNIDGFKAQKVQFRPSVTLIDDSLRRYDEGADPLDRARLHFLSPNGPAKPRESWERSNGYCFPVHDFPTYTGRPEWVMPVGAGELSAMVSFGTNEWHVHLSKTDYFVPRVQNSKDAELDLCSPGHLILCFDGLRMTDIDTFDQAMDVKRGRVTLHLETRMGVIDAELWGDRSTGALVGTVSDRRKDPKKGISVDFTKRPTDTGCGRFYETAFTTIGGDRMSCDKMPWCFAIKSAAGGSSVAAQRSVAAAFEALRAKDTNALGAERDAWWADFWSRSRIEVTGDERAALLERLWYAQLYVWAGVGFGKVPPKFNGGAGLVLGDSRLWGAGVWTQNTRELCWPLGAANHREFMQRFVEFYEGCRPQSEARHRKRHPGINGFRMSETIPLTDSPVIQAHTNVAVADVGRPYVPSSATAVAAWKQQRYSEQKKACNGAAICSSGTEILQQMVDYLRYYGDQSFTPVVAAWLRGQTELYLSLLEKGEDGKWHVVNTLENESWYCPEDCLVDLCAARFCLGLTTGLGRKLGFPPELVAAATERLAELAPLPTAEVFEMDNANVRSLAKTFVPGNRLYVPFKNPEVGQIKGNVENNELYAVFPFAMGDYDKNVETFRRGSDMIIYGWEPAGAGWGWYPVPMWAARLCLPDAADYVYRFAVGNNTWPFGGGRSPAAIMYKGAEVEDCPYLDSAGVLQAAIQELFLQSHAEEPSAELFSGGPIRLLPGVPRSWSGSFKLLARGGFEVECAFEKGVVTTCTALSTRGGICSYVDPVSGLTNRTTTLSGEVVVIRGP